MPLERLDEVARDVFAEMRLNGGAPIAVVGSGLSLPYGGMRWDMLTKWALREAASQLAEALKKNDTSREALRLAQAKRAVDAFSGELKTGATELYLAMQVASDGIALARESYGRGEPPGLPFKSFMARLASDPGYRLWLELCDLIDPGQKQQAALAARLTRIARKQEDACLRVVAAFYSWPMLDGLVRQGLRGSAQKELANILKRTRADLRKAGHAGNILPPDLRGLLPFVLAWLSAHGVGRDAVQLFDMAKRRLPKHPVLLRPVADPIRKLYHRLGIRRFITLNYDHEIENALMIDDLQAVKGSGYGPIEALHEKYIHREYQSDSGRPLYTGGIARRYSDGMAASSDIYQSVASARLFEFALNSPDYRLQILHQHGRADYDHRQPELEILDRMVLTDEDLNRLYRRNRRDATTLEQALDVTLTGNPILFVGIGLQEPEITRALRELVAQQRASIDDPAFAIMAFVDPDGTDPAAGLASWRRQIGLLSQYGIHMLDAGHPRHGGPGLTAKATALKKLTDKLKPRGNDHLPDVQQLRKLVATCVAAQVATGLPGDAQIFDAFAAVVKAGTFTLSEANAPLLVAWLNQLRSNQTSQVLLQEIDRLHDGTLTRCARTSWQKVAGAAAAPGSSGIDAFPRENGMLTHQKKSRRHVADTPAPSDQDLKDVSTKLKTFLARPGVTLLEGADFTGKGSVLRGLTKSLPQDWCHLNCTMSLEVDSPVILLLRTVLGRHLTEADTRNRLNNLLMALKAPARPGLRPLVILSGLERLLDARSKPLAPELELMVRMLVHPQLGAAKLNVLIAGTTPAIAWVRSLREFSLPEPVRMPDRSAGLLLKLENFVRACGASQELQNAVGRWRHFSNIPFVPNGARVPASHYLLGVVLENWHEIVPRVSRAEAELDRQILQNLAYVGQPLETRVLHYMPDVARSARQIVKTHPASFVKKLIEDSCGRLTDAGLAFYIRSDRKEEPENRKINRIALPRAVLAELRERFGVRSGEEQLSNSFTLTLAASMPHDLVIPDEDVASALARTVGHLRAAWKDEGRAASTARKRLQRLRNAAASALRPGASKDLAGLHMRTAGTIGRIDRVERLARMSAVPNQANLRAAAAIVRGFFNAATLVSIDPSLARWQSAAEAGDYEAHRKRIEKLVSRARLTTRIREEIAVELSEIEKELRDMAISHSPPTVDDLVGSNKTPPAGPLYSGELIWLLNEAGVIAQLQGRLKVAARHYREALFALDRYKGRGAGMNWRRLMINQAFLKIERGRIAEARADLNSLEDASKSSNLSAFGTVLMAEHEVSLCRPLIRGYLGLVDALEGHFLSAREHYGSAISALQKTQQQRALALFYWRRGALELSLGNQDAAHRDLNLAIAEAENGQQLDVVWRARLKATELTGETSAGMAATIFREARTYAAAMKLTRLEAMALHREAEWRMERGDLTAAAALATQAMCSATANGMTLMRIRLRTLMGEIMLRQGDPSGEFLLQRAVTHANRIGYQLQLNQARKALLRVQAMRGS